MKKRSFDGVIRACGLAITAHQNEFDMTSLWKHCANESDMQKVVPKAKGILERAYPGISVTMKFATDLSVKACISGDLSAQIPTAEAYLQEMLEKRNKQISFHQLRKYYNSEPEFVTEFKGFLGYIKFLFTRVVQLVKKSFSYKICKDKQKIVVQYS